MNSGMKKARRQAGAGLGVGASSILVIFVLLCLVTFAALSLVSARADWNLSGKAASHTQQYYAAANTAEATLADADDRLRDCYGRADGKTSYLALAKTELSSLGTVRESDGAVFLDYTTPVSDNQVLVSSIRVDYPEKTGSGFYTVTCWQVQSSGEWTPSNGLPVYSPSSVTTGAVPKT